MPERLSPPAAKRTEEQRSHVDWRAPLLRSPSRPGRAQLSDDNPPVSHEQDDLISSDNFDPVVLALSFETLRLALAHLVRISERRVYRLRYQGVPTGKMAEFRKRLVATALEEVGEKTSASVICEAVPVRLFARPEPAHLS